MRSLWTPTTNYSKHLLEVHADRNRVLKWNNFEISVLVYAGLYSTAFMDYQIYGRVGSQIWLIGSICCLTTSHRALILSSGNSQIFTLTNNDMILMTPDIIWDSGCYSVCLWHEILVAREGACDVVLVARAGACVVSCVWHRGSVVFVPCLPPRMRTHTALHSKSGQPEDNSYTIRQWWRQEIGGPIGEWHSTSVFLSYN